MFWRASGLSLDRRNMRRCVLPCDQLRGLPPMFFMRVLPRWMGRWMRVAVFGWASDSLSMYRVHDVTEVVESRSGGPFLTDVLHAAAERNKLKKKCSKTVKMCKTGVSVFFLSAYLRRREREISTRKCLQTPVLCCTAVRSQASGVFRNVD